MILSDNGAFSQIIRYPLENRNQKPRHCGITMVIDKGLGNQGLQEVLDVSSAYIDIVKLGFGSSCLYPEHILRRKLALLQLYSVPACAGGTLGEIALWQGKYEAYVEHCRDLGFTAMEISDGTLEMDLRLRAQCIQVAQSYLPLIITEVGKKLSDTFQPSACVEQILWDIAHGADYVIIEGRESGENVGIYKDNGTIDNDSLDELVHLLPLGALEKVIFEAPKKSQQVKLMERFGTQVNIGNVNPQEAIALECLRTGLRADTFSIAIDEQSNPQTD